MESDPDLDNWSFYSSDSYEDIALGLLTRCSTSRLAFLRALVPPLDLGQLPQYVSTDEEEENREDTAQDQSIMETQQRQQYQQQSDADLAQSKQYIYSYYE